MTAHSAVMELSAFAEHLPTMLFLLATGLLAGFFAGLLGIGGGLVIVPALFYGFDTLGYDSPYLMHAAVGTSLAAILPTGLSSARAHWRRGALRTDIFRAIAPGTLTGAVGGVFVAAAASGDMLQGIFGFAVLLVALLMFVDPRRYQFFDGLPALPWVFITGVMIGILASLMGIAGALLCVPFLVMCRVPMHTAVGTAAAIGLTVSLPAALGFVFTGMGVDTGVPYMLGYVSIPAFFLIVAASVFTAPLGARVAHSLDVNRLRRVFALFMIVIAAKMLYGAYGG